MYIILNIFKIEKNVINAYNILGEFMKYKLKKSCYIVLGILIMLFFSKEENKFYKNIKLIDNPDDYLVLVNKNNQLKASYIPKDLENISLNYSNNDKYLRKEAKIQFEKLSNDAFNLGYRIIAVSAYRDYNYQNELFNYYVEKKGLEYALECSAKPGHSEHQTGLAVDVEGSNMDYDNFIDSKEYDWMKYNAHKYGFILRYPKGKEHITGFKFEPWHYRYVGIETATYIYNNKLTLEEYLENKSID